MPTQAVQTTKSQPAAVPKTVKAWLASDYFRQQVALCLPKHLTPERFVRVALTALTRTPALAKCTPESVLRCMMTLSELGLEPDGRRAHLIPYKDACTLILDYKGLVELAKRSGDVSNIHAQIVCERDDFTYDTGDVHHRIDFRQPRGAMYAVYAIINFKDGSKHCEVMTREEIDAIRARSRAGHSGPWVTDYNEMAKKTVFRRASKWIRLSPEVADALDKEDSPPPLVAEVSAITSLPEPAADPEPQEPAPIEVPGKAQPVEPNEPAPAEAPPAESVHTVQQSLSEMVIELGYTFSEFQIWAKETGNIPDADSLPDFASVPTNTCKRLLRAREGLRRGLEAVRSSTKQEAA